MRAHHFGATPALALGLFASIASLAHAAFVKFENCLSDSITGSNLLQFTPYYVNAVFSPSHTLNLTIYGNVSGQQFDGTYPAPNSSHWTDNGTSAADELGKITNVGTDNKYTTLTALYEVVTYTAYDNTGEEFCEALESNFSCPLGPSFYANRSDPYDLPAFTLSHDFVSSYSFSTISTTARILSGDADATDIACISVQVTPNLGSSIAGLLTWLPAAILVIKGIATLLAAIYSPWGSSDIFRWSSNYGRDEDLLRLVTPGFGDCLQYIQFIVLTGSLTLEYPGFFQPAVSQAAWSCLLFNESFVSGGNGSHSLVDGLYDPRGADGLAQMSQLIGMTDPEDIWACMAIWLLVIAGVVTVACQVGFLSRWVYRKVTNTSEEDLRRKNLPFTIGNMNRLLFNYFILPIVSLSLFQLVISAKSPKSVVVCAVVVLVIMIVAAGWILRVIFVTKPRTLLFDDMPTVLLYGPLYNTYSDSSAPFALVPTGLTFMRGVAIGAVQPSGIAQIIILAICEVVLLLMIAAFRPFQGQTSMNIYHTFYASARVVTTLLMISFVPSLGVSEGSKDWIGYVILIVHGFVLLLGFFLNAAQTIIEVVARSLGAGGDSRSGAVRGNILSWRTLKRRRNRRDRGDRSSMTSDAAMLRTDNEESANCGGRSRSISVSSHNLLNRTSNQDPTYGNGSELYATSEDPETLAVGGMVNGATKREGENYYRPPRPRKATLDALNAPGTKTRSGADFPYQDSPGQAPAHARESSHDGLFGHDSPAPVYIRDRVESGDHTNTASRTDYAVREVDQYYRGPALNDQPTRRTLKTGPADPEGPASTAQGWFQRMVFGVKGGKKKDQSKGFEVVRSARAPEGADEVELQTSPPMHQEPYRDSPMMLHEAPQAGAGSHRSVSPLEAADEDDDSEPPQSRPNFDFGFDGVSDVVGGATELQQHHPALTPSKSVRRNDGDDGRLDTADTGSNYDGTSSPVDDDSIRDLRMSIGPPAGGAGVEGDVNNASRYNPTTSRGLPSRQPSGRSGDMASDWLRAVDVLSWNHGRPSPGPAEPGLQQQGSQRSFRAPPPSVPRRNSRRTSQRRQSRDSEFFEGFDSTSGRQSPGLLGLPSAREERPQSFTNASHHRAADSISRNSLGASAAMQASSAEYFSGSVPKHEGGYI